MPDHEQRWPRVVLPEPEGPMINESYRELRKINANQCLCDISASSMYFEVLGKIKTVCGVSADCPATNSWLSWSYLRAAMLRPFIGSE